jgi:hypothetical protein
MKDIGLFKVTPQLKLFVAGFSPPSHELNPSRIFFANHLFIIAPYIYVTTPGGM